MPKHVKSNETIAQLRREQELILDAVGEGIYHLDLNGNFVFVNPKGAELVGRSPDELVGKPAHETIHHKHSDGREYSPAECPILRTIREGAQCRITNDVFWRKDGTPFRVKYVSAPIRDQQGAVLGAIVVFDDVSKEIAAETRIKLQAEQYRLLFDTNPNPMWVFDTGSSKILAANQAAIAQYGYSREEFLTLTIKDLRPAQDVPELLKARAISSPMPMSHYSGQFRHKKKDGSLMVVDVYSSPLLWDGVAARMVTGIDVTERKRSHELLQEQARMLDQSHDAIIVRDFKDRRIVFWNRGAERLYGWSAEEAIGREIGLILADPDEISSISETLLEKGEYRGVVKEITKDGRTLFVEVWTTLIKNDDGSPRSALSINNDITEQKKLEMQLLRTQRLDSIGTLASGVAHDLNNVLTPIIMCSQIVRTAKTEEHRDQAVSMIEESARRGAGIVKQVLTFARGVEGERVPIKPSHLIDEMIDIAKKTFPKTIEISSRYPDDLWTIKADPTQLHQVLMNLCVNARDAMPNGGALVIWAENLNVDESYAAMAGDAKPGAYVGFRVSDTGIGMPPAVLEKIFDPFFTTKDLGKGTGLGLSTALGIVKSHGGFVSVYSEVGKGTTFKLCLPADATEGTTGSPVTSAENLQGNGELILVVDDEESILRVTKMILETRNYRVVAAHDGPEAVAIFARELNSVAVVLTDMSLPFMDGLSLIRSLKKLKPAMRFVASTGQSRHAHEEELRRLGVDLLLTKPYDTQKLLETLRCALTR
ncbi:MAG TPA: PAS domain S-box protein [Chthoniobacterales bacterium]|nr:PAS domain S-box protein [Chthoniobacterales bacterium]